MSHSVPSICLLGRNIITAWLPPPSPQANTYSFALPKEGVAIIICRKLPRGALGPQGSRSLIPCFVIDISCRCPCPVTTTLTLTLLPAI